LIAVLLVTAIFLWAE